VHACRAGLEVPSPEVEPPDFSQLESAAGDESAAPFEVAPRRTDSTAASGQCPSCQARLPNGRGTLHCLWIRHAQRREKPPESPREKGDPKQPEKRELKWWICVLIGLGMIPLTIYEYIDLKNLETEGGYRLVGSFTSTIYHIFGKTGVLIAGLLLSAMLIACGLLIRAMAKKKSDAPSSSVLKDLADALVILKDPLFKLVLVGLVVVNCILIGAVLAVCGFAREGIGNGF